MSHKQKNREYKAVVQIDTENNKRFFQSMGYCGKCLGINSIIIKYVADAFENNKKPKNKKLYNKGGYSKNPEKSYYKFHYLTEENEPDFSGTIEQPEYSSKKKRCLCCNFDASNLYTHRQTLKHKLNEKKFIEQQI